MKTPGVARNEKNQHSVLKQHSNFLSLGFVVRYITCSSISNDEIARARPGLNIKVAAYVKTKLWHNICPTSCQLESWSINYCGFVQHTFSNNNFTINIPVPY